MLNQQLLQQALLDPAISALSDADAAAQPGWSAPIITPKPFYVNARTLYAIDQTAAKAILAAIQASDVNLYAIMMAVGPNDGSAGGVDVSLASTQTFIQSLVTGNIISQTIANQIIALGQTSTYTFGAAVQTADVTAARAANTHTASVAALRGQWNTFAAAGNAILSQADAASPGTPVPVLADLVAAATAGQT